MSISLNSLPPELVSLVVANIESRPTLCNLARCSSQLYLHTVPYLYHHVTIFENCREGEPHNGRLRTLASLLIRRSDLAALVRHFTLHDSQRSRMEVKSLVERTESEVRVSPGIVEDDQAFRIAVNALSLSKKEKDNWLRDLSHDQEYHHDAILALLLPALPKVEEVVLDWRVGLGFDTRHLERMMRRAGRRDRPFNIQPPFQALTVFASSHDMYSQSPSFIASLLKLPAIREISGRFANKWDIDLDRDIVTDGSLVELDSSSSSLTSLDLAATTIELSTTNLGHILRAPTALRNFCYKICSPTYTIFQDTRRALRPHEKSLESLGLDCDVCEAYFYRLSCKASFSLDKVLGLTIPFDSFSNLKVLKIGALLLTTVDISTESHSLIGFFPPSLETLHLTGFQACFVSLLQALEHLLAYNSPQQIPSLEKLIREDIQPVGRPRVKSMNEEMIGRLSRVAEARGVLIEVINHLHLYW